MLYNSADTVKESRYSMSMDDDVARHVARVYSYNHLFMHKGTLHNTNLKFLSKVTQCNDNIICIQEYCNE